MAKKNDPKTKEAIDEVLNTPIPDEDKLPEDKEIETEEVVEDVIPEDDKLPDPENEETVEEEVTPEEPIETEDQKEKRYKTQQTEAQILAERNKQLVNKVTEAATLPDPTDEDLKGYVKQDGVDWEELTTYEKALAKKNYINEKRFTIIKDAAEAGQKLDERAIEVDKFIDGTDSKPEYLPLSGHELEFRAFAMQGSHRGVDPEILLGYFLNKLPATSPNRGSLFNKGGGGIKPPVKTDIITDAEEARKLRTGNQAQQEEYRRKLRAGKIRIEIE